MRNFNWLLECLPVLLIPLMILCLFLAGCDPVKTTPSTFCTDFHPIYPTKVEWAQLSDQTAQQILAADKSWKAICSGK